MSALSRSSRSTLIAGCAARPLDLLDDQARVLEQALTRWRKGDAAAIAYQQHHPKGVLHAANAGTGRREREVRAFGPVRDALRLGDVKKEPEIHQIKTHGAQPL
jgi:hypothetical protein